MAVGVPYEFNLQAVATGGTPPYKFAVTGGSLANGVELDEEADPSGLLSGTPEEAGNKTVVITLSDHAGASVEQSFTCMVQE